MIDDEKEVLIYLFIGSFKFLILFILESESSQAFICQIRNKFLKLDNSILIYNLNNVFVKNIQIFKKKERISWDIIEHSCFPSLKELKRAAFFFIEISLHV